MVEDNGTGSGRKRKKESVNTYQNVSYQNAWGGAEKVTENVTVLILKISWN